jgi:hypothetical protein
LASTSTKKSMEVLYAIVLWRISTLFSWYLIWTIKGTQEFLYGRFFIFLHMDLLGVGSQKHMFWDQVSSDLLLKGRIENFKDQPVNLKEMLIYSE